jgi:hypothetical protein
MLACVLMILAAMPPNQAEFKVEQVSIKVDIQSNIFRYDVTNLSTSPIICFEAKHHAAYNFQAPDGWHKEDSSNLFKAWTDDPQSAVGPNKTGQFSMRVSSRGAVLGQAPVRIQFQSGQIVSVSDVWSPSPEPRNYVFLVAGLTLFIILLHSSVLIYKEHRKG